MHAMPICNTQAFIACFTLFLSNTLGNALFGEVGGNCRVKFTWKTAQNWAQLSQTSPEKAVLVYNL